jgi:hypothetical protein
MDSAAEVRSQGFPFLRIFNNAGRDFVSSFASSEFAASAIFESLLLDCLMRARISDSVLGRADCAAVKTAVADRTTNARSNGLSLMGILLARDVPWIEREKGVGLCRRCNINPTVEVPRRTISMVERLS